MPIEYPNPVSALTRAKEWPPGHDIGFFVSSGSQMILVGTARDSHDVSILFGALALEWDRLLEEPADWFFTDVAR